MEAVAQEIQIPQPMRASDYQKPEFTYDAITLRIVVTTASDVTSQVEFCLKDGPGREQSQVGQPVSNFTLDCDDKLDVREVCIGGVALSPEHWSIKNGTLTVSLLQPLENPQIKITSKLDPLANTSAHGLYASGETMITQLESTEARRMFPCLDRPDVMSTWHYELTAPKDEYPTVLAGGTLVSCTEEPGNENNLVWIYENETPTPCYLSAVALGKYEKIEDTYQTKDGRGIKLELYTEKGRRDLGALAMKSLKEAMEWDEGKFDFTTSAQEYRIVVSSVFNFGAMENRRLNVFSDRAALFDPTMHTDADARTIKSVIGHEFFHDKSGNDVTLRDWFQIVLKEGLTVFREQLFMEETGGAGDKVSRIRLLESKVFMEDDSPVSKPILPDDAIDIKNLYTYLSYFKGAEVVRMIHTMIGDERFVKAMKKYIDTYKGQAVTIDEFIGVMAGVGGINLDQFKETWYKQEGVPKCDVTTEYNEAEGTYSVTVAQTPAREGQKPFNFPFAMALFDADGNEMPLELVEQDESQSNIGRGILNITQPTQTFAFKNISSRPVASMLRNYSAPVRLNFEQSLADAVHIIKHESDVINQYKAGQKVLMNELVKCAQEGTEPSVEIFDTLFKLIETSPDMAVELLTLPGVGTIVQNLPEYDFNAANKAQFAMRKLVAQKFEPYLRYLVEDLSQDSSYGVAGDKATYKADSASINRRRLNNLAQWYLAALENPIDTVVSRNNALAADNMTNKMAGLQRVAGSTQSELRAATLKESYEAMKHDEILFQKWLTVLSTSNVEGVADEIRAAAQLPEFKGAVANYVGALYMRFTENPQFHDPEGKGYEVLADKIIELNTVNAGIGARLAEAFNVFDKLPAVQKALMEKSIRRIAELPDLDKEIRGNIEPLLAHA